MTVNRFIAFEGNGAEETSESEWKLNSKSRNKQNEILNQAMSNTTDAGGAWHFSIMNDGKLNWNTYQKNGSNTNDDFFDFKHPTSGSLATSTWHHCCVARDGNTLRMYINGVQEGTKPFSGNLTDNNLGGNIYMSRRAYNTTYGYVRGYLDEIRFSNVCRYPDGHSFVPNTSISATATAIQSTNIEHFFPYYMLYQCTYKMNI